MPSTQTNRARPGVDSFPGFLQQMTGPQGMAYAALLQRFIVDPNTGRPRAVDFFVYSQTFLNIASGATASLDITIQADSDFLALAAVATMRDTGTQAADADREAVVNITDSGSGRVIFDRAQDFDNFFGTAQRPAWLPVPKFLARTAAATVQVTNNNAAARDFRVALWGIKVFGTTMGA